MAQKYLIQRIPQKGIGRIWLWTTSLAKRTDMALYSGPVPESMIVNLDNLNSLVNVQAQAEQKPDSKPAPLVEMESQPGGAVPKIGSSPAPETGGENGDMETEDEESAIDMTPKLTPEEKTAKLIEICSKLEQNAENFTNSGLPRVDVLMMRLDGVDVSTKERDAAWAAIQNSRKAKAK